MIKNKIKLEFVKNRIATLRNSKNVSARQMSQDLDQSTEYINQIENGRSVPSLAGLLNICDYFEISPADFFDEKTEYPLQYKSLIEKLNKLDSMELGLVIDFVNVLTKNKK